MTRSSNCAECRLPLGWCYSRKGKHDCLVRRFSYCTLHFLSILKAGTRHQVLDLQDRHSEHGCESIRKRRPFSVPSCLSISPRRGHTRGPCQTSMSYTNPSSRTRMAWLKDHFGCRTCLMFHFHDSFRQCTFSNSSPIPT